MPQLHSSLHTRQTPPATHVEPATTNASRIPQSFIIVAGLIGMINHILSYNSYRTNTTHCQPAPEPAREIKSHKNDKIYQRERPKQYKQTL